MFEFIKNMFKQPKGIVKEDTEIKPAIDSYVENDVDKLNKENEDDNICFDINHVIIVGENRFDTSFLTYMNIMVKLKKNFIEEFNNREYNSIHVVAKKFKEEFSWPSIMETKDIDSFGFVKEFFTAVMNISDRVPIQDKLKFEITKSESSLDSVIIKIYNMYGLGSCVSFDFYKVPSSINSALDVLGYDQSSLLEEFLNSGDLTNPNIRYVNIVLSTKGLNKSMTVPVLDINKADPDDRFLLESIYVKTYKYCMDKYGYILRTIIRMFKDYSIEENIRKIEESLVW